MLTINPGQHMEHFWTHVWIFILVATLANNIIHGDVVTTETRRERSKDDFVRVLVPTYVREGETALLKCMYDADTDKLYSVKWYKGSNEFYRFTPKELPPTKNFPTFGGLVDLSLSSYSDVALMRVGLNMSDKYTCEVTKDFPDYTTSMKTARMTVVALPEYRPIITPIRRSISIGDTFKANCTSTRSNPVANITWMLNKFPVAPHYLTTPIITQDDDRETIVAGINFTVRHQHFIKSRMTLTCHAKIDPDLYSSSAETIIMEHDRPRISSVVGNYSSPATGVAAAGENIYLDPRIASSSGPLIRSRFLLLLTFLYTSSPILTAMQ